MLIGALPIHTGVLRCPEGTNLSEKGGFELDTHVVLAPVVGFWCGRALAGCLPLLMLQMRTGHLSA